MSSQRDEISSGLVQFIHNCFDSVEQLQILLLLLDGRARGTEEISHELRSTPASVQKRLKDLQARGVLSPEAVTADGQVRFIPVSKEVEDHVLELNSLYKLRPHRVIAQIFAKPPAAIQSFADAFRLRKDPPA